MSKKIRNTITIYDANDAQYSLVMIPAKTTYVYDSDGNKVNKDDNLGSYSFRLYKDGGIINPSDLEVSWTTPLIGSCVTGSSKEKIFVPQLTEKYNENSSNNTITLKVKIKDQTLIQAQPISIIKAVKNGEDGQDGSSSKIINLVASSLVVKYDENDVPSSERIELTAYSQNLSSKTPTWSVLTDRGEVIIEKLDTSHGVLFSNEETSQNPRLSVPHDAYFWDNIVVAIRVTMDGVSDIISLTKLKDGSAGAQGRTYRNLGMWVYSEKYGADRKYIDLVRYKGDVYECLEPNVGKKPTNENYWRLFIEKGEPGPALDWVKDWDSHKTQVGDDYIISPKIFLGQNGNLAGDPSLTGIAIGRDVYGQTNGTIGIVGYNDNKHTFEMLTDGSAYFGIDPKRRFIINYDGSISTPDLTADTIKGGTLALGGKWRKLDEDGNVIIDVVGNDGIRGQSNGVLKVFDENTEMYTWDSDLGEYRWKTYKEINAANDAIVTVDTNGIKMTKGVIEGNGMLLDVTGGHFQIGKEVVNGKEKYRLAYNHSTKKLTLEPDVLNITTAGEFSVSDGKGAELSFKNGIMVQKAYNYEFNSGKTNNNNIVEGWRFRLGANNTNDYALRFDNSGLNINPTNLKVNASGNILIGTETQVDVNGKKFYNYLKFTGSNNTLELRSGNVLLKGGANWQFRLGESDDAGKYSLNYRSNGSLDIRANRVDINASNNIVISAGGKLDISNTGNLNIKGGGNLNIESTGNIKIKNGGNFTINSGGKFAISSSNIELGVGKLVLKKSNDGTSVFNFDGSKLTLGSDVELTWGESSDENSLAGKVTKITKNTVTTEYVDALKVKAGSVDANNINAGTVSVKLTLSAATITSGTISGGTITGGAISGGTITGAIIKSRALDNNGQPTGRGINIESEELTVYNDSGQRVAMLKYDTKGQGNDEEAENRVFLNAYGYNTALKLFGQNGISLSCGGGFSVWLPGNIRFSANGHNVKAVFG